MATPANRTLPIAVIGAGPCGLATCKTLAEFGIAYECFEASDSIGGIWNVERGSSGGYRSLQTNTSKPGMEFTGFPFAKDIPTYPDAQQMLSYFKRYAAHHHLEESIRINTPVENAQPLEDGSWQLGFSNGETLQFGGVIVASGQYVTPRIPHTNVSGEFSGQHLHVYDYLDAISPVDMRGKRVLVVGLGSSAAELAAELCDKKAPAGCAEQVILSARSGRWVLPKIVNGSPMDARAPHAASRLPALLQVLPSSWSQWIVRRVMGAGLRKISGNLGGAKALGLPEPDIEPWEDRPTMSLDFIPALRAGLIDVRPGIEKFDGSTVHFSNGSHTEVDIILYTTGYDLDFPYLDEETLGCTSPELALYQRISHPVHDNLFFVGCCKVMCSLWPLAEQQSRWIAALLNENFQLPDSKVRFTQAESLAKSLPVICNCYVDGLRKQAGGSYLRSA